VTYSTANSQYGTWDSSNTDVLFEISDSNKALIACPWDVLKVCPWMARDVLTVYYRWSTGPSRNLVSLVDAGGATYTIDPPQTVEWLVPAGTVSNSGADYSGSNLFLRYEGPGRLHGFPEFCQDKATGQATDCGENTHWIPDISIRNGETVRTLGSNPIEYAVKSSQTQIIFETTADQTPCTNAGLSVASTPDVPTDSAWQEPSHFNQAPDTTDQTLVKVVAGVCVDETDCVVGGR